MPSLYDVLFRYPPPSSTRPFRAAPCTEDSIPQGGVISRIDVGSLSLSLIHFRIKVCRTRLLQQVSTTHRRSLQIRRRTIPQRRRRLARRCKLCRADCAAGNQAPRARESQVFRVNRWQSFPESRDDRGPSKEANSIGQRRRNENIGKIKKKIVDKKREERWKGKKIKNRERAQGS